uniref:Ribosomal protein S3 n=1 Tax=Beauveria malawiensis TaxID=371061 RepID=A0A190XCX6_9HYPO|nr:ribosomal protein S3 [Beauveria malawiensis]AMD61754.1 ribosomal protein S3 [Beauveria malawiensis]
MRVITESGFTKPNLKPSWIEDYSHVVKTNIYSSFNPMFSSRLPWLEIELSEIVNLNRPKIVGINFDFSHQNVEVVLQEFKFPKAFYVSHEHVAGLTPSNYKECIINYYHIKAYNKPSILLQAILIENGDAMKVIKSR